MMHPRLLATLAMVGILMLGVSAHAQILASTAAPQTVTIFAAASTKPVLDTLAPMLAKRGIELRAVHAGSSTLARQIVQGAPADIFLCANNQWMDHLTDLGRLESATKRVVARNQLVLISGTKPFPVPMMVFGAGSTLDAVLGDERLAVADPDHVPAGIYAREALGSLKLWNRVKAKLARTSDVTSALMLVARGEARLGVVYASEVRRSTKVSVFAQFPEASHSPITYLAATITGRSSDAVDTVMAVLNGPEGRQAFIDAGFEGAP